MTKKSDNIKVVKPKKGELLKMRNVKKTLEKMVAILGVLTIFAQSTVFGAGLNVCTHCALTWPINETITTCANMNGKWMRDEIRWVNTESSIGTFRIPSYAKWVDEAVKNGINPLCILCYGNGRYQEGDDDYTNGRIPTKDTKTTPAEIEKENAYWNSWMTYANLVATTYKGKIKAYEIWNEPNHTGFNNNVNAENYAKLYLETRKVIKAADPDAIVLCGSVTGSGASSISFINGVLSYIKAHGGLSQIDAFSIHLYCHGNTPEASYTTGINNIYNGSFKIQGYTGPIWMTENGAYTGTEDKSVTEEMQGAYAIRFPVMWDAFLKEHNTTGENFWYDFRNDGTDLTKSGNNYGLTYNDYSPKPGFKAAKIFNELTDGMNFKTLKKDGAKYTAEYADKNGNKTYVLWTTNSEKESIMVNLTDDVSEVYSYQGVKKEVIREKGSKVFEVSQYPTLIYSRTYAEIGEGTVINYNNENRTVSISGNVENFRDNQQITVLAVPHNMDVQSALLSNAIGYIGTISAEEGVFSHEFTMPKWYGGSSDIYISGTDIVSNMVKTERVEENQYAYVAELNLDKSSFTATASLRNFSSESKNAVLIIAGYKDSKLVDVKVEKTIVPAKTYTPLDVSVTIESAEGSIDNVTLTLFFMSSIDTV